MRPSCLTLVPGLLTALMTWASSAGGDGTMRVSAR